MNSINQSLLLAAISGTLLGAANVTYAHPNANRSVTPSSGMSKDDNDRGGDKHSCKGQNSCKGQGGCKTDKHACKGQNSCKGQGGCKSS